MKLTTLQAAKAALAGLRESRESLRSIADSIADGTMALSTSDKAELERLMAEEVVENIAAHDRLQKAIRKATS